MDIKGTMHDNPQQLGMGMGGEGEGGFSNKEICACCPVARDGEL